VVADLRRVMGVAKMQFVACSPGEILERLAVRRAP
jgi:hypothetical protein